MREFLKQLFTLKTVYIDKGAGRWVVRKRFHPLIRFVLSALCLGVCLVIYAKSGTIRTHDAEAITKTNDAEVITAKLPEPDKAILPPVQTVEPVAVKPEKKSEPQIIIPLKNNKTAKKTEIILPSEANPNTDRIIAAPKPAPKIAGSDDKYRILINKSKYTLSLFKGGELVKDYRVAVGKNTGDKQKIGDNRTPVGKFKIVSIENASSWSHDFRDGKGKIAGAYGPWFLRLDAKGWRGIGIHGTHDPDSLGTNATEGCIRLKNEDIADLKENYAKRGMVVEIREN